MKLKQARQLSALTRALEHKERAALGALLREETTVLAEMSALADDRASVFAHGADAAMTGADRWLDWCDGQERQLRAVLTELRAAIEQARAEMAQASARADMIQEIESEAAELRRKELEKRAEAAGQVV